MRLDAFRHNVLALLMVSDHFASSATSIIQPRFFESPSEQYLCRFILDYYREFHQPPSKLSLRDKAYAYFNQSTHLQKHLEEFDVLLDTIVDLHEDAANEADYIEQRVVEFCREEALKEAFLKSVDDIQNGKLEGVLPRIEKAMSIGAETGGKGVYLLEDADQRETVEETRDCIPTGYDFMDGPTKGGLARGELCILMAPPNTGKTTYLINIGTGILKNRHKAAHFTLEMSQGIVRAKYDQCLLKKTDEQLKLDDAGAQKLATWMKKLRKSLKADVYIKDFPAHKLTVEGLKAHLMLMKARDGFLPDAVLLDYMDIMAMPTHIKEEHKQLAWLGVELRALAVAMNIAIWTVTQTNRGGATKQTAMGEDISNDFTKVATADVLQSFNQTLKEAEDDIARIFYVKNRIGKKYSTFTIVTDFERSLLQPE